MSQTDRADVVGTHWRAAMALLGADQHVTTRALATRDHRADPDDSLALALLDREPLYRTKPARRLWAEAARRNLATELADLRQLGGAA